jgi:hypothetical protein
LALAGEAASPDSCSRARKNHFPNLPSNLKEVSELPPRDDPAKTIDDVVRILEEIVDNSKRDRSRIGYFSAVYLRITRAVKAGIDGNAFTDSTWVEQLDVAFANRYFLALQQFQSGRDPGRAWMLALTTAARRRPIILQHVLLGINAHINFDLGIATAAEAGANLENRKPDFDKVNDFAAREVKALQDRLGKVSPLLGLSDLVNGKADDRTIVNFGIDRARAQAWQVAELLSCLPPATRDAQLQILDRNAANVGRLIRDPPGVVPKLILRVVRMLEWQPVRSVIAHL